MGYRLIYTSEHEIKPFSTTLNQFWGIGYTDERRYPISGNIMALIFRVNEFQGYTGALGKSRGHNGMAGHSTLYKKSESKVPYFIATK